MSPEARLHRIVPWNPSAARGVLVWTALSAVALAACWYQSAGEGVLDDQIPWVTVAVLLVLAEMYALVGLVLSGRRAVGLRRLRMLPASLLMAPRVAAPAQPDAVEVFVVAGSSRFHRRGCALIAGREARALPLRDATAHDLRPCGICAGAGAR